MTVCLLQQLENSDNSRHHQATRSVLEIAAITRDEAGAYTCRASNDAGNATVDVTVVVECKPAFHFSIDLSTKEKNYCIRNFIESSVVKNIGVDNLDYGIIRNISSFEHTDVDTVSFRLTRTARDYFSRTLKKRIL